MAARMLALPPANQVAASGFGGGVNSNGRRGEGNGAPGFKGNIGSDLRKTDRPDGMAGAHGTSEKTGSGSGGNAVDANPPQDLPLAGSTRFTLPRNGKFSVIVTGSSAASPYPEGADALSGKMVYSVYSVSVFAKNGSWSIACRRRRNRRSVSEDVPRQSMHLGPM